MEISTEQMEVKRATAKENYNVSGKRAAAIDAAPERLLVVSHVVHYEHAGRLYAYGAYAREIDIWADLFPKVVIAAPCRREVPPDDALAFTRRNISIDPIIETGGKTRGAKLRQVLLLPVLVWHLARSMRGADAIHVRFPANVGFLGVLLAPLFSPRRVAKYAGQWNGYAGERWVVRAQRALLRSRWWGAPVTVYGEWENEPEQIVPFFTSMMTGEQVERAAEVAAQKRLTTPLRVLFSGRLAPEKRVGALLDAVKIAVANGVELELSIVGDGTERAALESQAAQLGIEHRIRFIGALPFDESLRWNEWAHCLVLPSTNCEGWPKVVAEAMCYGSICIAVDHGQVAAMLQDRGIMLEHGTPVEIAAALQSIAARPEEFEAMRRAASIWACRYSLEGLRQALADLLSRRWNVSLKGN
ncbi:MAG: glycosyltransferase [Pyrinomonadaceae bacterium MAG19_C2-C3]|nr:glycosyltransferase [Pyrinomonadaceae bacterium MAG19_C2-C3]